MGYQKGTSKRAEIARKCRHCGETSIRSASALRAHADRCADREITLRLGDCRCRSCNIILSVPEFLGCLELKIAPTCDWCRFPY